MVELEKIVKCVLCTSIIGMLIIPKITKEIREYKLNTKKKIELNNIGGEIFYNTDLESLRRYKEKELYSPNSISYLSKEWV